MKKKFLFLLFLLSLSSFVQLRAGLSPFFDQDTTGSTDSNNVLEAQVGVPLQISLLGSVTYFLVTSSGTGTQRTEEWRFDHSDPEDFPYTLTEIHEEMPPSDDNFMEQLKKGMATKDKHYTWNFISDTPGVVTLIFKRYSFTDALVVGKPDYYTPIEEKSISISVK